MSSKEKAEVFRSCYGFLFLFNLEGWNPPSKWIKGISEDKLISYIHHSYIKKKMGQTV